MSTVSEKLSNYIAGKIWHLSGLKRIMKNRENEMYNCRGFTDLQKV